MADQPTKSKARSPHNGWATSKEPAWSGTVTGKADVSRHTLRIPAGKLQKGRQVRWRARATIADASGVWSEWQTFKVGHVRSGAEQHTPVTVAAQDQNGAPFDYERMSRTDCNNARKASPRPYHGFGWTVLKPYSACYSRILGWGDWEVDLYTGLPKTECPKSEGVMMTANVIAYTNLGTENGRPVVYGESTPELTARDISVWISITEIKTVGANCTPTTAYDNDTIQLRAYADGSDNSDCTMIKGANRTATIGTSKETASTPSSSDPRANPGGTARCGPSCIPAKASSSWTPLPSACGSTSPPSMDRRRRRAIARSLPGVTVSASDSPR